MNKHYILSLFDETVKTVGVKFNGIGRSYTYKTRLELAVGDKVVVDTPSNGFQVVDVVRIDDEPDFEVDSLIDYKWIVCKVDVTEHEANQAKDAELHKEIAKVQRKHHREAAKNALAAQLPGLANLLGAVAQPEGESAAFHAGFTARCQGDKPEDNPYKQGLHSDEWIRGYREATRAKAR